MDDSDRHNSVSVSQSVHLLDWVWHEFRKKTLARETREFSYKAKLKKAEASMPIICETMKYWNSKNGIINKTSVARSG